MINFNPFTLRERLQEYAGKYAKQARVIVRIKSELAKHTKENDRLLAENHQLKKMVQKKDERITQMHDKIKNQLEIARMIDFYSWPRKVKREAEKQAKRNRR